MLKKVFSLLLIFTMFNYFVYAHSGRTDANGGHYNRKTGVYHYHNSGGTIPRVSTSNVSPPVNGNTNSYQGTKIQGASSQGSTGMQAVIDAERDASAAADQLIWLGGTFVGTSFLGCLFCGLPSIAVAYIYQPQPPTSRLIGKSPEYVMIYQQTFKEKVRGHQTRGATLGCIGGSVVAAIVWGAYYSQ